MLGMSYGNENQSNNFKVTKMAYLMGFRYTFGRGGHFCRGRELVANKNGEFVLLPVTT